MYLFDKVSELTQKFKKSWSDRKKSQALENYSSVAPFQHRGYLTLIKQCMNEGFLGEKESDFLNYMLNRYDVNYLDWAHKTRWLKKEMSAMASNHQREMVQQQDLFDWDKKATPVSVPLELIARQAFNSQSARRI